MFRYIYHTYISDILAAIHEPSGDCTHSSSRSTPSIPQAFLRHCKTMGGILSHWSFCLSFRPPPAFVWSAVTQVVVVAAGSGQGAPPGVPAGGQWVQEPYLGPITWCIGLCLFWPVFCCPCDTRMVRGNQDVRWFLDSRGLKFSRPVVCSHVGR